MADFWRTRTFRTLSKDWDQILEKSGFNDVEKDLTNARVLKKRASSCYERAVEVERETKLEYYCFLGYLANNTIFPSELEKLVMIRHSEGAKIQEITREIENTGISRDRKTVRRIIRRWQMKWGVREWSLKELHLKKPIK